MSPEVKALYQRQVMAHRLTVWLLDRAIVCADHGDVSASEEYLRRGREWSQRTAQLNAELIAAL